ncbi:VOC family protein [Sciscionella sediminilitoris]|uniref:VOC family protein n=1 Tax=Sciscionella sediminilitoris TaxID=1445613 RepID=UPI0004DF929C|nr:glyoxalase [Sciscionella sp. SE31]
MGQPIAHFEIIGTDPARLRGYYGELFGWRFGLGDAASEHVSAPEQYGFVDGESTGGINGGIGGGPGYGSRVLVYVAVPDVGEALRRAEELGGARRFGPIRRDGFAVGQFTDPEDNVIGLAGAR